MEQTACNQQPQLGMIITASNRELDIVNISISSSDSAQGDDVPVVAVVGGVLGVVVLGLAVLVCVLIACLVSRRKRRRKRENQQPSQNLEPRSLQGPVYEGT